MYSYLIRRILPFFVFAFSAEAIEFIIMAFLTRNRLDLSFLSMMKTSGTLMITTIIASLYLVLPYVIYILITPAKYAKTITDKIITTIMFGSFVGLILTEEAFSFLIWQSTGEGINFDYESSLECFAVAYKTVAASYPIQLVMISIIVSTLVIVALVYKYLLPKLEAPTFGCRLYHTSLYILICVLSYLNLNIVEIKGNANSYNNHLAEEGSFVLIKNINEKEIAPVINKIKN